MRIAWALSAVATAGACESERIPPGSRRVEVGQWIWSRDDSSVFAASARVKPNVVPTVWIGSIHGSATRVSGSLGLSPRLAGSGRAAVVIRFEDTFTRAFVMPPPSLTSAVDSTVGRLLAAASATGVAISEVQLDYDCPQRLLAQWAALVDALSRGALAGRTVWVTSLVTHIRQAAYGDLFRSHVAGHILQVFDTGDRMTVSYARQVERLASRHRIPFRLGVAAFERRLANGGETDHAAWFGAVPIVAQSAWYRGVWVFPGGQPWAQHLE